MEILVADSGSTKTDWAYLKDGKIEEERETQGINPYFHGENKILDILLRSFPSPFQKRRPEKIFFYGAGCSSKFRSARVENALHQIFPKAKVFVQHDMLGAARASSGDKPGLIAILGTGSNACHYNGTEIVHQRGGIGYVLGDEGSGAHMGKALLQRLFYDELPGTIADRFYKELDTNRNTVIEKVYRAPNPNRYLASLTKFIKQHIESEPVETIVKDCFSEFLTRHILHFPEHQELPMHCVGSVAYHFHPQLEKCCQDHGVGLGNITTEPIKGLTSYHLSTA